MGSTAAAFNQTTVTAEDDTAMTQRILFAVITCLSLLVSAQAFVSPSSSARLNTMGASSVAPLKATSLSVDYFTTDIASSSSSLLSLLPTIDPTELLSGVATGFINSNAILAVPILAALAIVAVIAFGIFSYASPADEDD